LELPWQKSWDRKRWHLARKIGKKISQITKLLMRIISACFTCFLI